MYVGTIISYRSKIHTIYGRYMEDSSKKIHINIQETYDFSYSKYIISEVVEFGGTCIYNFNQVYDSKNYSEITKSL